jgi:hypothetical protein
MSNPQEGTTLPFDDPPWDALEAECQRLLSAGRAWGVSSETIRALEAVLCQIHEQQAIAAATYGA